LHNIFAPDGAPLFLGITVLAGESEIQAGNRKFAGHVCQCVKTTFGKVRQLISWQMVWKERRLLGDYPEKPHRGKAFHAERYFDSRHRRSRG